MSWSLDTATPPPLCLLNTCHTSCELDSVRGKGSEDRGTMMVGAESQGRQGQSQGW